MFADDDKGTATNEWSH